MHNTWYMQSKKTDSRGINGKTKRICGSTELVLSSVLFAVVRPDLKNGGLIPQKENFKDQIACPEKRNNKFAPYDALNQNAVLFEIADFAVRLELVEFIDIHDVDALAVWMNLPFYLAGID